MECGQDPSLFWRLTLREVRVVIDGAVARMKRDRDERAILAWHIAALSRQKKLPKLKDLITNDERRPAPKRSWEEDFAGISAWFKARK